MANINICKSPLKKINIPNFFKPKKANFGRLLSTIPSKIIRGEKDNFDEKRAKKYHFSSHLDPQRHIKIIMMHCEHLKD
jgi:hypothetical protein